VMADLRHEMAVARERLDFALGFRGTVAIGFSVPSSHYVLKVIRDRPTANYKWETFPGVTAVLEKYRIVHESDRAGSMLDNVILDTVRFEAGWFAPELLEELSTAASDVVKVTGDSVMFSHLIVQIKMVPVPEFLKTASEAAAQDVLINLGNCIRNNAAANIFNRDLDARNYGVSPIGKVYLFDYDAVEPLTGVKFRTNAGRFEGEEDLPDWFFETGTVFLPEELLTGLRIDDPGLRRFFREVNGDLMTVDYWDGMQRALLRGLVPKVLAYPVSKRLKRPGKRG
jgi:isocitrate dehydrogenase kinase/phosphatase